jgi:hypothetical protein
MFTAVLIGWDPATYPHFPRIWARIHGRYWSAKIDDISLWSPGRYTRPETSSLRRTLKITPRNLNEIAGSWIRLLGNNDHVKQTLIHHNDKTMMPGLGQTREKGRFAKEGAGLPSQLERTLQLGWWGLHRFHLLLCPSKIFIGMETKNSFPYNGVFNAI